MVGLSYVGVTKIKKIDGTMFTTDFGMSRWQGRPSAIRRRRGGHYRWLQGMGIRMGSGVCFVSVSVRVVFLLLLVNKSESLATDPKSINQSIV